MAVRGQGRVVINREALDAIDLGLAQGLEALARQVLRTVKVPDAAPFGEGLVEGGGYLSYVDGKRVGGDPEVKKKPKDFLVRGRGVAVAVGFGFPGRFQEMGTENQPARPFLTPVVMQVVGSRSTVENALREALRATLQKRGRRNLRSSLGTRA